MSTTSDMRLRDLAMSAIPSAWSSLDGEGRDNIVDLLSTYDHVLALKYLAKADSLAPLIAAQIRDAIAVNDE